MNHTEFTSLELLLLNNGTVRQLIQEALQSTETDADSIIDNMTSIRNPIGDNGKQIKPTFLRDTKKDGYLIREYYDYDKEKKDTPHKMSTRYTFGNIVDREGHHIPYFIPSDHYLQYHICHSAFTFMEACIINSVRDELQPQ